MATDGRRPFWTCRPARGKHQVSSVRCRSCVQTESGPLGRLAAWCVRHRLQVSVVTFAVMAVLAMGVPRLTFEEDPFDALPADDPHTGAAERLIAQFPGNAYASPVFVSVEPDKWHVANQMLPHRGAPPGQGGALHALLSAQGGPATASYPGPTNITDEVYMRAMDEMYEFVRGRVPEVTWGITLPSEVRLVNYTNTGVPGVRAPDPAAFTMPGTDAAGAMQYQAAWQTFLASSPDAVKTIVSADWRSSRLVFLIDSDGQGLGEIGAKIYAATNAYKDAVRTCDVSPSSCDLVWNTFDPDAIIVDPRGAPAASHHLAQTTGEDMALLAPIVGAFIAASLLVAFRRPGTVAAVLAPLGLAGAGVVGALGWIGVPMHSVSLLVFPIIMGNGIDFGIHMASAYHRARQRGLTTEQAAAAAGDHTGVPLALATITTLAGVVLLVFAPNTLLSQLGLAILVGMMLLLTVSLTTLPAALSWTASPRAGLSKAPALAGFASMWRRHKLAGGAVVVALLMVSLPAAKNLETFVLGTPAADFGPGDAQRQDFDESNRRYFVDDEDLVSNVLVMEGDLTTPAAMELMERLQTAMRELSFVRQESVTSIRFAMESWLMVREGTAGAPGVIARETLQPGSTFPTDQASIRALIDEMFATPLATYASFFIDAPSYRLGTMLVEIRQDPDLEGLARDWHELLATIDRVAAGVPGHGISIHVAGQTAVSYLFTAKELPYLTTAALIGPVLTGGIVWALRRNLRDAAIVAAVITTSGIWWLACLYLLDIALSIALVVPVVVLAAIGSDYALHLRHGVAREGQAAWATVGRAVMYSALTDIGAFLIFTRMRYGLLHDAAWATVAALVCALAATLLVVPLLEPTADTRTTSVASPSTASHAGG